MSKITLREAKEILYEIVKVNPDNRVEQCLYVCAGGDTDRCIAGEFFHHEGVNDDILDGLDQDGGTVTDLVARNRMPIDMTKTAAAFLRAAQAYQDGSEDAATLVSEHGRLSFARRVNDVRDNRQEWSKAFEFAELYWGWYYDQDFGQDEYADHVPAWNGDVEDVTKAEEVTDNE